MGGVGKKKHMLLSLLPYSPMSMPSPNFASLFLSSLQSFTIHNEVKGFYLSRFKIGVTVKQEKLNKG